MPIFSGANARNDAMRANNKVTIWRGDVNSARGNRLRISRADHGHCTAMLEHARQELTFPAGMDDGQDGGGKIGRQLPQNITHSLMRRPGLP